MKSPVNVQIYIDEFCLSLNTWRTFEFLFIFCEKYQELFKEMLASFIENVYFWTSRLVVFVFCIVA